MRFGLEKKSQKSNVRNPIVAHSDDVFSPIPLCNYELKREKIIKRIRKSKTKILIILGWLMHSAYTYKRKIIPFCGRKNKKTTNKTYSMSNICVPLLALQAMCVRFGNGQKQRTRRIHEDRKRSNRETHIKNKNWVLFNCLIRTMRFVWDSSCIWLSICYIKKLAYMWRPDVLRWCLLWAIERQLHQLPETRRKTIYWKEILWWCLPLGFEHSKYRKS